jgi:hypothetical protein
MKRKSINGIFCFPNEKIRTAVEEIIMAVTLDPGAVPSGYIIPQQTRDTPEVMRDIYLQEDNRVILNISSPEMLARINNPVCALGVEVDDPVYAGGVAKSILQRNGLGYVLVEDAERDLPHGLVVFLCITALPGIVLVFQRLVPTEEQMKALTPAAQWPGLRLK